MTPRAGLLTAMVLLAGCSSAPPPAPAPKKAAAAPPRITQFYTTTPSIAKGERPLICYGVENATKVWLEPPRQELSASLTRCVEVAPEATTEYKLTAEGEGPPATQTIEITIGPSRPKIVEVRVSALSITRGQQVSICYVVRNAAAVEIEPAGFRDSRDRACAMHAPRETTTYTVTARNAGGAQDRETVTVTVR